jgi:hypothetical protein
MKVIIFSQLLCCIFYVIWSYLNSHKLYKFLMHVHLFVIFFINIVMHPTFLKILCMHLKNASHTTILHKCSSLSMLNTNHYNYEDF